MSSLLHPAVFVILTALVGGAAWAAPETSSHPLGLKLDGELKPSTVYVRFTAERFDMPFDAWATRHPSATDPAGRAFVGLVRALRADDVGKATPLLDPRGRGEATPDWVVGFLREGWGELATVQMMARYRHAGDEIFTFRVDSPEGPWVRSLAFREYMSRWQGRVTTGMDPAISLIDEALTHGVRAPSTFRTLPRSGAEYAVPLDTAATVFLEFDGRRDRFMVADGKPQTEAQALFQQGMWLLARSEWPAYATLFTPLSAKKIVDGYAAQDPGTRAQSGPLLSHLVEVRFEMDLGPAGALIIYTQGNLEGQQALHHQYVTRVDGQWKLTNFFRTYQLGSTMMRSPTWPREATRFEAVLDASRKR